MRIVTMSETISFMNDRGRTSCRPSKQCKSQSEEKPILGRFKILVATTKGLSLVRPVDHKQLFTELLVFELMWASNLQFTLIRWKGGYIAQKAISQPIKTSKSPKLGCRNTWMMHHQIYCTAGIPRFLWGRDIQRNTAYAALNATKNFYLDEKISEGKTNV